MGLVGSIGFGTAGVLRKAAPRKVCLPQAAPNSSKAASAIFFTGVPPASTARVYTCYPGCVRTPAREALLCWATVLLALFALSLVGRAVPFAGQLVGAL